MGVFQGPLESGIELRCMRLRFIEYVYSSEFHDLIHFMMSQHEPQPEMQPWTLSSLASCSAGALQLAPLPENVLHRRLRRACVMIPRIRVASVWPLGRAAIAPPVLATWLRQAHRRPCRHNSA